MKSFVIILVLSLILSVLLETNVIFARRRHRIRRPFGRPVNVRKNVKAHSHPYQVGIYRMAKDFCSGVLIAPKYVLTSFSCVEESQSVQIVLGAHNINKEERSQYRLISINHTVKNDLALIELPTPVIHNRYIDTIPVASNDNNSYAGEKALLVDWYRTEKDLKKPLKQSRFMVIRNDRCSRLLNVKIGRSMLCTIPLQENVNGCPEHPGAPLVLNGELIGIVSYANLHCKSGNPIIYSRVNKYSKWINKTISKSE